MRKILEDKLYSDIEKLALSLIKWAEEKGVDHNLRGNPSHQPSR